MFIDETLTLSQLIDSLTIHSNEKQHLKRLIREREDHIIKQAHRICDELHKEEGL